MARQSQALTRPLSLFVLILAFLLLVLVPGYTLWTRILRPAAFAFFLTFGLTGLRFHWAKVRRGAAPLDSATRMFYLLFFSLLTLISAYHLLRFLAWIIR